MTTITVAPLAADAIAHHLGVALPLTLTLPVHGRTGTERRALLARGLEQAHAAGLLTADGLDRFVWDAFHLLDRPAAAVYFSQGDVAARRDRHVVAAADSGQDGARAVLAELDADGLTLTAIRPTTVAAELLALLPPAPPAPGPRSATAPRRLVTLARDAANGSAAALATALSDRGVHPADARLIAAALSVRPSLITEICAAPGEPMIHVLDTAAGRYLVGHRGEHVVIMPGHPELIHREIQRLIPVPTPT